MAVYRQIDRWQSSVIRYRKVLKAELRNSEVQTVKGLFSIFSHLDFEIDYGNPMSLAHEVAHAIEMKIKGWSSEATAWELARSFLKPELWDNDIFFIARASYSPEKFIEKVKLKSLT